ncbi:hypothetical protein TSUD_27370 [Trifolium subterraneum]|uniref:Uncharacterized protein n=1 Tax=Trifolium subterraneum TaxID=3900 RepID=A0A2Z6N3V4_TRISU|nr:hypothetical protein TSUD_27370 [Trifolium subterraneum]
MDVKNLRRSDRTRTRRCKNIKGSGNDPSQPMTIDDEAPTIKQDVGPSSQSNLHDPRVEGCLSALIGMTFLRDVLSS